MKPWVKLPRTSVQSQRRAIQGESLRKQTWGGGRGRDRHHRSQRLRERLKMGVNTSNGRLERCLSEKDDRKTVNSACSNAKGWTKVTMTQ